MTTTERIQAILAGSFMLALLMQHDKEIQTKGSVIRLRQKLQSMLRNHDKDLKKLANEAYDSIKNKYEDDVIAVDVSIINETLVFAFETPLKKLFSNNIIELVDRANQKLFVDNTGVYDKEKVQKDSYMIADELKDAIRKFTFEYTREGK